MSDSNDTGDDGYISILSILSDMIEFARFFENVNAAAADRSKICRTFLVDCPYLSREPRLGCCVQLIKSFKEIETIIQRMSEKDKKARRQTHAFIKQQGTREHRDYQFLMQHWHQCRSKVLEYDRKVKEVCGRTDFIVPAPIPEPARVPPPKYENAKSVKICPECNVKFKRLKGRKKVHCKHCLRVVCLKCTSNEVVSAGGPAVRLCTGCLSYLDKDCVLPTFLINPSCARAVCARAVCARAVRARAVRARAVRHASCLDPFR